MASRLAMQERDYITVVSGVPRSGTSMMMQMLDAGGLPVLIDHRRAADIHNPLGYFEYEAVKLLARNASWMLSARGKAVKIIYRLLPDLPQEFEYRVIFMERELGAVLSSQREMLRTRAEAAAEQNLGRMFGIFKREVQDARAWLGRQPNVRVLITRYEDVLADPQRQAAEISSFLDGLDVSAMAAVVDGRLRHHGA